MNLILRWILNQISDLFVGCFALINELSSTGFNNAVVKALLNLFKTVGLPLFGIAILVLLIKMILAMWDGKEVNFGDLIQRSIFGTVIYMYGVDFVKYLYLYLLEWAEEILAAIAGVNDFNINLWDFTFLGEQFTSLMIAILMFISLFYMMKTFLNLLERFWLMVVTMLMLYLYLPGYIAGNDESVILWFKQCVAIGLTQLIQTIVVVFGISLFAAGGGIGDFALSIGAIIASSKVDQIMDKWGMSAGGKVGNFMRNGMSTAFYATQIKSMFLKKGGA